MTTYGQERSLAEKEIDATILARVQRGLKWLEQTWGPGWEEKIDLETLNLVGVETCVIGQLYGSYVDAINYGVLSNCEACALGFTLDTLESWRTQGKQLQVAWEDALRPRVTRQ